MILCTLKNVVAMEMEKKKQLIGAEISLETIKTSLWILDSKS